MPPSSSLRTPEVPEVRAQAGQKGSQDQMCLVRRGVKCICSGTIMPFRRDHQLCMGASERRSAVSLLCTPWGQPAAELTLFMLDDRRHY